jgi:hypothetical protein
MTLKQIEQFEREKRELARRNIERQRAAGEQVEFPDSVRSAGMVMGMTDEQRKQWFKKMREESGVE